MKVFLRRRDPGQQGGRRLQIPVGARKMGMPQICAKRHHVPRQRGAIRAAVFERTDGKTVSQVVDPRCLAARCCLQPDDAKKLVELDPHRRGAGCPAKPTDEQIVRDGGLLAAYRQPGIQDRPHRGVQHNHPALAGLARPDDQPLAGDVADLKLQRLRQPQACRRDKAEEQRIHLRPDPTIAALTGKIEVRFADTTLLTQSINGTAAALEFSYALPGGESLTVTAHAVYLPRPRIEIKGPKGVQASFDWQAALAVTPARMCTVVLVNSIGTY